MKLYVKFPIIILVTSIIVILSLFFDRNAKIKTLNSKNTNIMINENSLPIVKSNQRYIEEQTNIWIERRNNNKPCYGFLEKDKIVMMQWIEHNGITVPKLRYKDYYTEFTKEKLVRLLHESPQRLVFKVSHLQSSYGIILSDKTKHKDNQYIDDLYSKIQYKFKGSFVCNHDKNDPPSNADILERKVAKQSHYKLYETIEPGLIVQDFFDSYGITIPVGVYRPPIELKVMVFGGNIVDVRKNDNWPLFNITSRKYSKVLQMARDGSSLLGSALIRVDIFIQEDGSLEPYVPYLNEISLSPNGGLKNVLLRNTLIDEYRKQTKISSVTKSSYINELLGNVRRRSIPIEYYFSDKDFKGKKIVF